MTVAKAPCDKFHTKGCGWCGKKLVGKQRRWCSKKCSREFVVNHRWTQAKAAIKKESAWYQCAECDEFTQSIEVNHIEPCLGQHGVWGCHHHRENLELLCIPCHKKTTAEQRASGKFTTKEESE